MTKKVSANLIADTFLICNEISSPASAGGDFLKIDGPIDYRLHPLSNYYATELTLTKDSISDDSLGKVQPYFCHFLLEAIYRNALRGSYTLEILEQWKAPVKECSKGIVEGFYKPVETYAFDHRHVWAGTPAYALPLALSGLSILEPGFKRISLSPSLLGLKEAHVQIPTPMGMIELMLKEGNEPQFIIPNGIMLEK